MITKIVNGDEDGDGEVFSGFGFCAKINQYKVVMLVCRKENNPVVGFTSFGDRMVEIHTIGTKSWRTIGTAPKFPDGFYCATIFNGAIHWLYKGELSSNDIISFDLESEKLGVVPTPAHFSMEPIRDMHKMKIGGLGDLLYLSYNKELWVMKEYGVQESWTKIYADREPFFGHQVKKLFSCGKILMNDDFKSLFLYDPAQKISKEIKVPPIFSRLITIAHVPSFMSFHEAMMGGKGAKLHARVSDLSRLS